MTEERTTKAYKTSQETRALVENLFRESGLSTEGEFLAHMAAIYELQQQKTGPAAGYAKTITEVEYLGKRMAELFLGVLQSEGFERSRLVEEYDEKVNRLSEELLTAQQEIQELKAELQDEQAARAAKAQEAEDLRESIKQLHKQNDRSEELLQEFRTKVEDLADMLARSRKSAEEADNLRAETVSLRQQVADMQREVDQAIADRKAEVETHVRALQDVTARAELDRERAVLETERRAAAALQAERNANTESQRQLLAQLEKLRDQLDNMRDQIAELRNPKTVKRKPGEEGKV